MLVKPVLKLTSILADTDLGSLSYVLRSPQPCKLLLDRDILQTPQQWTSAIQWIFGSNEHNISVMGDN